MWDVKAKPTSFALLDATQFRAKPLLWSKDSEARNQSNASRSRSCVGKSDNTKQKTALSDGFLFCMVWVTGLEPTASTTPTRKNTLYSIWCLDSFEYNTIYWFAITLFIIDPICSRRDCGQTCGQKSAPWTQQDCVRDFCFCMITLKEVKVKSLSIPRTDPQ